MNIHPGLALFSLLTLFPLSESLRRVLIRREESRQAEEPLLIYDPAPSPSTFEGSRRDVTEFTTTQKPESPRKTMRKIEVKPRGGKRLKETKQKEKRIWETTQTPDSEQTTSAYWTHEQIMRTCSYAERTANGYGIADFSSFASTNCSLIQLYYPDASCEEISNFISYCLRHRA